MKRCAILGVVLISALTVVAQPERTFTLEDDRFVKDGKPTQLISGRYVMHAYPEVSLTWTGTINLYDDALFSFQRGIGCQSQV